MDIATFKDTLPEFGNINVSEIEKNLDVLLKESLAEIEHLLTNVGEFNWENLMQPFESIDDRLNKFWSPISHLNSVMNNEALREAYEACLPKLSDYGTAVSHNRKLYEAILSIKESIHFSSLESAQQKVINNNLRDFKLSGVSLGDDKKKRYADISKKLAELTNRFENHILDATKAWTKHITDERILSGLPEFAKQQAAAVAKQQNKEGWVITLEMPAYFAVITYAENRALREEVYHAYTTRASDQGPNAGHWDNSPIMHDILKNRVEISKLLDFGNYAEKSLATKMVETPDQVLAFLNELVDASLPAAHKEFEGLQAFATEQCGIDHLEAWDVTYVSEKLRESRYAISQEELRPYFPESQVVQGLFGIVEKLFQVKIQPLEGVDVWHPDVRVYSVHDLDGSLRAAFYFDLYARTDKRGGAWMDDCQGRRRLPDGSIQLPVAYVTCNFNGPVGDTPALFKHDEVVTLFHEFGHALQHMLTTIDYAEVAGINGVPWDAVEVASQFLENWAWQESSMPYIAKHYKTGESLPQSLFDKMINAKNFQSAMMMVRQLEFALFDFELHVLFDEKEAEQIQLTLDKVRSRVTVVPVPEFNRFQHSFSHIFAGGYAAGYYSYKWAEVMAADAFGLFLEKGIFDENTSQRFRETFLEQGGAVEPAVLFEAFRGRAPEVKALLEQSGIVGGNV